MPLYHQFSKHQKYFLFAYFVIFVNLMVVQAQVKPLGFQIADQAISQKLAKAPLQPKRTFQVKVADHTILQALAKAPKQFERTGGEKLPVIELPSISETPYRFEVFEAPLMEPALAAKYPNIRSYTGRSIDDPTCIVRLNATPNGLYAVIHDHKGLVEIKRDERFKSNDNYVWSELKESSNGQPTCQLEDSGPPRGTKFKETNEKNIAFFGGFQAGNNLRTFRLALAVTSEFISLNDGGSGNVNTRLANVNAAIVNRISAVNLIYERDAAIRLVLVGTNDNLITPILTGTPDPFSDPSNTSTSIDEGAAYIESIIGEPNYDIGHCLHEASGPGISWRFSRLRGGVPGRYYRWR